MQMRTASSLLGGRRFEFLTLPGRSCARSTSRWPWLTALCAEHACRPSPLSKEEAEGRQLDRGNVKACDEEQAIERESERGWEAEGQAGGSAGNGGLSRILQRCHPSHYFGINGGWFSFPLSRIHRFIEYSREPTRGGHAVYRGGRSAPGHECRAELNRRIYEHISMPPPIFCFLLFSFLSFIVLPWCLWCRELSNARAFPKCNLDNEISSRERINEHLYVIFAKKALYRTSYFSYSIFNNCDCWCFKVILIFYICAKWQNDPSWFFFEYIIYTKLCIRWNLFVRYFVN